MRRAAARVAPRRDDDRAPDEFDHSVQPPTWTLPYSATPGGCAPVLPDLTRDDLRSTRGARHSTLGCLYSFAPTLAAASENADSSPEVVLVGHDCDGAIDEVLHPTREERVEWADAGYVEWGLATRF